MTTDIEKQFFEAFGIEPKFDRMLCDNDYQCNGECNNCEHQEDDNKHKFYPQITDRILLELITFLADAFVGNYCVPDVDYINLEWHILNDCIKYSDKAYIKQQIQSLFEVNNNDR